MRLNFGILLLLFGATIALGAGFLAVYLGAFRGVEVREVDSPAFTLLYKSHTGAYHKINDKLVEVEDFARANGIPCPQTFGDFEFRDAPSSRSDDSNGCSRKTRTVRAVL